MACTATERGGGFYDNLLSHRCRLSHLSGKSQGCLSCFLAKAQPLTILFLSQLEVLSILNQERSCSSSLYSGHHATGGAYRWEMFGKRRTHEESRKIFHQHAVKWVVNCSWCLNNITGKVPNPLHCPLLYKFRLLFWDMCEVDPQQIGASVSVDGVGVACPPYHMLYCEDTKSNEAGMAGPPPTRREWVMM